MKWGAIAPPFLSQQVSICERAISSYLDHNHHRDRHVVHNRRRPEVSGDLTALVVGQMSSYTLEGGLCEPLTDVAVGLV